jgi:hypothetical protein
VFVYFMGFRIVEGVLYVYLANLMGVLMFNVIDLSWHFITCRVVSITNFLHNFMFDIFAATCFALESRSSSGNYETFRCTQYIGYFLLLLKLLCLWASQWPRFIRRASRKEVTYDVVREKLYFKVSIKERTECR